MIKQTAKIFIVILLGVIFGNANAQIAGGYIAVKQKGLKFYEVSLVLNQSCASPFQKPKKQRVFVRSSCNDSTFIDLDIVDTIGVDITQVCPLNASSTVCAGGTLKGYRQFTYKKDVLSGNCGQYILSWKACCRENSINLSTLNNSLYIETTYNTSIPFNSSVVFVPFNQEPVFCNKGQQSFQISAFERDADSLVYELVPAKIGATTNTNYSIGFTGVTPLPNASIDVRSGKINFSTLISGVYVVAVKVSEFSTSSPSAFKSSTTQEFNVQVVGCNNRQAPDSTGNIFQVSNATKISEKSISVCPNTTFTFKAAFTDPNGKLSGQTNIKSLLPGSSFSFSNNIPLTLTVSGRVPAKYAGKSISFVVSVWDDSCPQPMATNYIYTLKVNSGIYAGEDFSICQGDSVVLKASGSPTYSWLGLNGTSLVAAQGLSCANCSAPQAKPQTSSTYIVSGGSSCGYSSDTVRVNVTSGFNSTLSATPSSIVCAGIPVKFNFANLPSGQTKFLWYPADYLNNPDTSSPTAIINNGGLYRYSVRIESAAGCVKMDTISITIKQPAIIKINAIKYAICKDDTAKLSVATTLQNYTWSPNSAIFASNAQSFNSIPTANIIYTLSGKDANNCVANDTVAIKVNTRPLISVTPNGGSICRGQNISITAIGGLYYSWLPATGLSNVNDPTIVASPSSTTFYTIVGVNAEGCIGVNGFTVVNNGPSYQKSTNAEIQACLKDTVNLAMAALNATNTSYSWYPNSNVLNNPTVNSQNIILSTPGINKFFVKITDLGGSACSVVDTFIVNGKNSIANNLSIDSSTTDCNNPSKLAVVTNAQNIVWSPNTGITQVSVSDFKINPPVSTNYQIKFNSIDGCKSTINFFFVSDAKNVIEKSKDTICAGYNLLLTPPKGINYSWEPLYNLIVLDSGTVSVAPDSNVTYTCHFQNSAGCKLKSKHKVKIDASKICDEIVPYTGITPNGDGLNDFLFIDGIDYNLQNYVVIYNRWGDMVWSTHDYKNYTNAWFGTKENGEKLLSGPYFYFIKTAKQVFKGRIELLLE